MSAKIQKWGNSLGIRIPKSIIEKANLNENSEVEIENKDGAIIIFPRQKKLSLDKPVAPNSERFEALHETFGDYKTVADLLGFLAYRDRFGDNFYRLPQLGISRATYHRKVQLLKDAGLWLSSPSDRSLSALSEVHHTDDRKAA